jgi:tRNA nucleotidyltransferase (CCA-adding enzyme)
MADYVYMMETRLLPEQQRAVAAIQQAAVAEELNLYLTGGAVRDLVSGLPIRDLDFTVQGNALKLQKELEKSGATIVDVDEDTRTLALTFPGTVRAEVQMARSEKFDRPGRPTIAPATIADDLRRRDFTVNAMALSLNAASRGLLLDPANGAADVESKLLRILHSYSFLEDPSRLIRATRFSARFHWPMEERTQARYDAAKENSYIDNISNRAIGYEIEQLAYENDPLHVMKALEKEGWLRVLHPHWSTAKADSAGLSQLGKLRQQFLDLGYTLDAAPAVMYFLTARLNERETGEIQRLIPHKEFVNAWRHLEDDAKELAKKLTGKEAATPSRAWQLLSSSRPETILFLEITTRNQAISQKLRNFLGKWRQVKQKLPLPEMAELFITPELPAYPKLAEEAFLLLLDGKLRSRTETLKFLKPYAPPPPPPPPPPPAKRGRAKAEAAALAASGGLALAASAEKGGKGTKAAKGAKAAAPVAAPPAKAPEAPKKLAVAEKKAEAKPAAKPKPAKAAKASPKKSKPRPKAISKSKAKPKHPVKKKKKR